MFRLLGKDPFAEVLGPELQPWEHLDFVLPMSDEAFFEEYLGGAGLPEEIRKSLQDRGNLRSFCRENGLSSPEGKQVQTFDELSKFVISRNTFPLVMKSCRNRSNGTTVLRLEGFREMSPFFNRLQNIEKGPVWVENWIKSDAVIEVTRGPGDFSLVSQIALDKKLVSRPLWRQFPVKLPSKFQDSINRVVNVLTQRIPKDSCFIRLTIGLTKNEAVLLSINAGWNRLEYFPGWTEPFGLIPAFFHKIGELPSVPEKRFKIGRIQIFYRSSKSAGWPVKLPPEAANLPVLKYLPADRHAAVLFGANEPATLAESARILSNILAKSLDTDEM